MLLRIISYEFSPSELRRTPLVLRNDKNKLVKKMSRNQFYKGICKHTHTITRLLYKDRNEMINYGKYDEELFDEENDELGNDGLERDKLDQDEVDDRVNRPNSRNTLNNSRRLTQYRFDLDSDSEEDGPDIGCSCMKGLRVVCSYMKMSDECFETFTEKSMALTMTLFKFIKVLDEFGVALELLIQSYSRIRNLIV